MLQHPLHLEMLNHWNMMMKENYWSLKVLGHYLRMLEHYLRKMKMVHYWNKVVMVKENWLSKIVMENC